MQNTCDEFVEVMLPTTIGYTDYNVTRVKEIYVIAAISMEVGRLRFVPKGLFINFFNTTLMFH